MVATVVVLVGPGGSFGAFDREWQRPPLGNELFSKLAAAFPATWGNLPNEVVAEFESDEAGFELGMATLREEGVHTQRAFIDMGIYFSKFRLHSGINRYLALEKLLKRFEPGIQHSFASLNYETYLEQSIMRIGRGILYSGDAPAGIDKPFVRVTKPHGSCNFVAETGNNTFINARIEGAGTYLAGAGLKVVPLDDVPSAVQTGFPPAMSLYVAREARSGVPRGRTADAN